MWTFASQMPSFESKERQSKNGEQKSGNMLEMPGSDSRVCGAGQCQLCSNPGVDPQRGSLPTEYQTSSKSYHTRTQLPNCGRRLREEGCQQVGQSNVLQVPQALWGIRDEAKRRN